MVRDLGFRIWTAGYSCLGDSGGMIQGLSQGFQPCEVLCGVLIALSVPALLCL